MDNYRRRHAGGDHAQRADSTGHFLAHVLAGKEAKQPAEVIVELADRRFDKIWNRAVSRVDNCCIDGYLFRAL